MVNDARRNHVHIEVCHHVGAYYHGTVLFVEGIDHQLQRSLVSIYIVTVQLHGKLAAQGMVHAQVPATADTQIVTLGNEVNQAVILFIFVDGFGSAVGRMIVDNDQIELEFCFLAEHRTDGIAYGADAVTYRDYHGSFIFKVIGTELYLFKLRFQITAYLFQVFGASCFHFDLPFTILRVYIIEYFFTTLAGIILYFRVEIFVDVYQRIFLR